MMKFDYDDVLIEPSILTDINSRKDINPYYGGKLPIMTAPMDTVINSKNYNFFEENNIHVVLPRYEYIEKDNIFNSFSLKDFIEKYINDSPVINTKHYVLIDTANGHIKTLLETTKQSKEKYGDKLVLMVGNVANPETYKLLSEAGADFIRVGIGNGGGCLTTQQLGIGYPMGSLINECYKISLTLDNPAFIIADGGIKKYADIIKALALGADFVMIGNIFNKAEESASETYLEIENIKLFNNRTNIITTIVDNKEVNLISSDLLPADNNIAGISGVKYKKFRGMSTKEVQKNWSNESLKTSEGIVKFQKVEYTLSGWVDNFDSYLRSAMSYTNSKNLNEFIGNVNFNIISEHSYNRFNK